MTTQTEVERVVLSELLNNPECYLEARQLVRSADMFTDPECRKLFETIVDEYERNGNYSYLSVAARARGAGLLDSFVSEIYTLDCGFSQIGVHVRVLVDLYMTRLATLSATDFIERLRAGEDVIEAMNVLEGSLSDCRRLRGGGKLSRASDIVMELLEDADRIRAGEKPDSTPFGWVDIDQVTGGMEAGDLVVIAAPEKSGKTTMMLQIALHNARLNRPVMIFSTEMKPKALLNRLNLLETGLSWTGYKQGKYTDKNWETYAANLAKYGSLPLFIRYGNFSVLDIMAESKYVIRKHGVKLLAVDYIQRIEGMESRKVDTREREVAMISSGLKSLAMEYNIPVLALSQVNADLRARESRAIEQDMDKMITIDTTERKNVTDPMCAVDLKLRQRMGPGATAGELKLLYDSRTGSWKNHSPVSTSFA